MTLSDLASVGSLISGIAVLASLIYLAQQTRQNTKHTRAIIQQGRSLQATDHQLRLIESESLADVRLRGEEGDLTLNQKQIYQYSSVIFSTLMNFEDAFHQNRAALLGDDRFGGTVRTIERRFQRPGFRCVWKQVRGGFGLEFRSFMDEILSRTLVSTGPDLVSDWKIGIEAELSEAIA